MTALLALTFFTVVSTSAVVIVARLLEATAWRRSLLAIEFRMPLGQAVIVQWLATGAGTPAPVPSLASRREDDLPSWLAGEELTDSEAIRSARAKQADALLRGVLRVGIAGSNRAGAVAVCSRVWGQL